MATRTYYDLKLTLANESLHPLTVRALARIVEKRGEAVSLNVLVDSMFGVASSNRASKIAKNISLLRNELDELCSLNPKLLESGPLSKIGSHSYRLTAKAVSKIDGRKSDEDS